MDRDLESLEKAPEFSWPRLAGTVLVSVVILAGGSYLIRAYPYSGYDAGYAAVMEQGREAVRAQVDSVGGSALPLCRGLHDRVDRQADQPHYDYDSFLQGCASAVEELYGAPVPLTDGPR
jgi:hypothetical protein